MFDEHTSPAADLATWLLLDSAGRTPGLRLWLLSEARNLPDDLQAARIALDGRWPALSAEEREMAFLTVRNVLRGILNDMEAAIDRLEALADDAGHG